MVDWSEEDFSLEDSFEMTIPSVAVIYTEGRNLIRYLVKDFSVEDFLEMTIHTESYLHNGFKPKTSLYAMIKNIEDTKKIGRRNFLNKILKGGFFAWLLAILYPIFNYLEPPKAKELKISQLNIGKSEDMAKDSGKIVKFGNKPVIVIRKSDGEYIAFSAVCTHLSCLVQYRKDFGQIYCACHNGKYDLNGKNISGPPPSPLDKYNVAIKNDDVFIYKDAS